MGEGKVMRLYIVRHAIAVPRGTPGVAEEDRALTEEGIKKMEDVAAGMHALGYVPDAVLSSPLRRARETAAILFKAFKKEIPLGITPALAPSGNRPDLYREICSYKKLASLMLVGHQPSLGEIAGEIIWGSPEYSIEFKKGGACLIELQSVTGTPNGVLVSLVTPSILRKLVS